MNVHEHYEYQIQNLIASFDLERLVQINNNLINPTQPLYLKYPQKPQALKTKKITKRYRRQQIQIKPTGVKIVNRNDVGVHLLFTFVVNEGCSEIYADVKEEYQVYH